MFYNIITNSLHLFCKMFFKINLVGLENIPTEGRIILAANHKSNLDPVFIAGEIRKRKLTGLAKKELNKNKLLAWFIKKLNVITIDRENPDISTIKKVLKALKDDSALVIFPEGTRVKGEEFGDAKQGLGMFAIKGKSNIVPISIVTNYKIFSTVTIFIDKPISVDEYLNKKASKEDYAAISQDVMDRIKDNYYRVKNNDY